MILLFGDDPGLLLFPEPQPHLTAQVDVFAFESPLKPTGVSPTNGVGERPVGRFRRDGESRFDDERCGRISSACRPRMGAACSKHVF